MDALPEWPVGTVAVLSTGAGEPHAIPISTAVFVDDRELRFALARRRESLARLREDPRCALTFFFEGITFTAIGRAVVERELERVAVLLMRAERIQDHRHPTFEIDAGVAWHWTSAAASADDD